MRRRSGSSIKSFLTNQLVFGGYSNLITSNTKSFEQIEDEMIKEQCKMQMMIINDPIFDTASFEYRNERSGLRITHKINTLVSLDEQDLISCKLSFKELARICKWSDDIQLEVLTKIEDTNL
ncbi:hypothetical protein DMUE_0453 [Dictyocoela muelleri]|nr:hypothetical protein DMUE_0453 [Dictyocoela muelleri]